MNERKSGILLSYINFALNGLIMLLYVPMLLHYVSKEQYGVYQMVGSFIAVIVVLDFGLCATVTRFVSRERSLNHPQEAQRIIQGAATLYAVLTGVLLLIGAGAYFLINPIYGGALSAADLVTAKQIFLILLLNFAVGVPGNLFIAILWANERFVFYQLLLLAGNVLSPLIIWGVLWLGQGVIGVVWVQTLFNILFIAGFFLYCKIKLQVHFGFRWRDIPLLKQLIGFSFFVFLGSLAWQLYSRLGPLVLGLLTGAVAVANYYIASQILMVFSIVTSLVNSVFLPKLTGDFATTTSLQTQNDIFCKTGRLQLLVAALILTGFILLGKSFLQLWLGPGNEICYSLAMVLMAGMLLNVVQSVGGQILLAIDKYRFFAYVSMGVALLNALVACPFIARYGTMGCAISFALIVGVLNGVLMNWYYYRIGLDLRKFFKDLWPVFLGSIGVLTGLAVMWRFWPVQTNWPSFILHGLVVVAVYASVMLAWVLNRFEKDILKEIYGKVCQVFGK